MAWGRGRGHSQGASIRHARLQTGTNAQVTWSGQQLLSASQLDSQHVVDFVFLAGVSRLCLGDLVVKTSLWRVWLSGYWPRWGQVSPFNQAEVLKDNHWQAFVMAHGYSVSTEERLAAPLSYQMCLSIPIKTL